MNLYERLRERLALGFFPDNFLAIARLAEEASWQVDDPLGLYVLSAVLFSLGQDWGADEQGIETARVEEMTRTIKPSVTAFLEAASERELSTGEEADYLNEIVRSLLRWRSR